MIRLAQWLERASDEGHDSLGAFELPLGIAVCAGLALRALAPSSWLSRLALLAGLALAVVWGHHEEHRRLYASGRRRFRGTLHLRLTWLLLGWCLLWSGLLLTLAHLRAWDQLRGWQGGPILLSVTSSLYFTALGVQVRVRRWIGLGAALGLGAVLLPWLAWHGSNFDLLAALWIGGAFWCSAFFGQREYERQRRASNLL